jgi:predicted MPP superfamily phosphohydrolase
MTRRMFLMGGVSIFPYLYLERLSVAVRRYRVPILALPAAFEGFTILHLSDLHDKEFGRGGEELITLLARESFDLVVLTGDLVAGGTPRLTPALELIAGITRTSGAPVYSVSGNHDWRQERGAEFNGRLCEAGVRVLSNGSVAIERGKDRLWLLGVDDPVTKRDRLDRALSASDNSSPRVLLAHSPQPFAQAVQNGVDLMLAGHTHGGQVRIPLLGAPYVPAMGFFPRFDYGLYSSGPTTMIVSGGLGESALPIRFNMRPEVSLVTLERLQGVRPVSPPAG